MISKTKLKKYVIDQFPNKYERKETLENWLINFVCNDSDNAQNKLIDITVQGCVSGCVGPLIYNFNCKCFYDKFETKIWDLIEEFRENMDQTFGDFLNGFSYPIEDETSFKVHLAWFAVEETAYRILSHFEEN